MRILVTGAAGQLGYDIIRLAEPLTQLEVVGIDIADVDLTNERAVQQYFAQQNRFDAIIHCAAYTAVDAAEDDIAGATNINVKATQYLVTEAKKSNAKFIYISTDYVYSGEGVEPFTVDSPTNPVSVYGKTKLAGETLVKSLDKYFIVRISWVFGINGNNFVKTMLQLAETRTELTVVDDQIGSPTYTYDLAKLLLTMVETDKYGVYLASNEGFCSWYEFALAIFKAVNVAIKITPVNSAAFPTKAQRPHNSCMSKDKLEAAGFAKLPSWQDALKRYILELDKNK